MTRAEAIKELNDYITCDDEEFLTPFDFAIKFAIESLKVDEQYQLLYESTDGVTNGWIPIKERQPSEDGWYLVSGGRKVWICQFVSFSDIGGWANHCSNPCVEAWQKLPAPYKEESNK